MKSLLPALAVIVVFAVAVFAQTPRPTPPAEDDVVRITTSLIQLDVTVTDKKGNPIRDLRPEEVEIFENGKKQAISNFSFVAGAPAQEATDPGRKPETVRSAVQMFPASPIAPSKVRRTIAIVIDDLTLSFPSTFWVKKALKKYIEENVQEGDLVAIIRTAGGIGALQQFTSDRRQLMAAVEKLRFDMRGVAKVTAFTPIAPTLKEELNDPKDPSRNYGEQIERERESEREMEDFRSEAFAAGTLGALSYVVRGMGQLPGRKSVVVLSDGFRMVTRDAMGRPKTSIVLDALRRLGDMANRSAVVIYAIDARGLEYTGPTASDNFAGISPGAVAQRLRERDDEFTDSQQGLQYLAEQTGGFAIINSNDINWGMDKVLNDQSYYLIGYEPDDDTFDPKTRRYNKIEVRVTREGARVRYRSGFFGITDEQAVGSSRSASEGIVNALLSPFVVNDIPVRLHAVYSSDNAKTSFVRSYVHIPADQLKFTKLPYGQLTANFDIAAVSFGDNGMPVDHFSRTFTLTLTEETYKKSLEKGIVYQFAFPVKRPGGHQYRVALRDAATNKLGSASQYIEVPNLEKKRPTLSGIVLENMPRGLWQKISSGTVSPQDAAKLTDPERDTALRQFPMGTVLRYGAALYNANPAARVSARLRIFKDGTLHFEGKSFPVERGEIIGGLTLGKDMPPGEYVMQLVVEQTTGSKKPQTATQFVQFDIIE